MPQRQNVVMRAVERGPDQVVHRRVHHYEFLRRRLLPIEDTGEQHARRADDRTPGLDHNREAVSADPRAQRFDKLANSGRAIGRLIRDAEAAAQIDVVDRVPVGLQTLDQGKDLFRGFQDRRKIQDLRSDVAAHARRAQVFERPRPRVDRFGRRDIDAELVIVEAGADVRVRRRVYIRIDAQRETRRRRRVFPRWRRSRASSASDSQLKLQMPLVRANSISAAVLPTPEKTTRDGSPPA